MLLPGWTGLWLVRFEFHRQEVHPIHFFFSELGLPFPNIFCGFFPCWICELVPRYWGNDPLVRFMCSDIHCNTFIFYLVTPHESSRAAGDQSQGSAQSRALIHSRGADCCAECLPSTALRASWLRHMLITKHISSRALAPSATLHSDPPPQSLARPLLPHRALTRKGRGQDLELILTAGPRPSVCFRFG